MDGRILAVAAAVTVVAGLTVAAQTDVTGTWNTVVQLDVGTGDVMFVLNQDGETLTGTYEGAFGSADVIGKVMGDMIEFTFVVDAGAAKYTGKIMGDSGLFYRQLVSRVRTTAGQDSRGRWPLQTGSHKRTCGCSATIRWI